MRECLDCQGRASGETIPTRIVQLTNDIRAMEWICNICNGSWYDVNHPALGKAEQYYASFGMSREGNST
jgi:hypothetical protein